MKITFVLECAGLMTNGTTASCLRFAEQLKNLGHQVTIIGGPLNGGYLVKPYVVLDAFYFPFFEGIIRKEGFQFVKIQDERMVETIKNSDVVHFFLPFKLADHVRLIAEKYNVPVTGAFHLQPDTITSAIHISLNFINYIIYKSFNKYIYEKIDYVHCPSKMIADKLKKYGYHNELRVMSNGISTFWHRVNSTKPEEFKDKFIVSMVGRLAGEKRQDLLIKAVAHSKHEKDIQLILCGQGPNDKKIRKWIDKYNFTNKPIVTFKSQEDLRAFLSYIDLYVHCADCEIEGLSCVEAFSCGVVPVISNSKLSATHGFALCEESKFKHGNYKDLAKKIDYWFEHPDIRKEYSKKYIESSKDYALDIQVEKFEEFFEDAINYYNSHDRRELSRRDKRIQKRIFSKIDEDF